MREETQLFEKYESNVRSYCRKWPSIMNKAKGSFYYDVDGNKYIDFFNGAGALNYGHNPDYIKNELIKYLENDGIIHGLDMYSKAKYDFIKTLEEKLLIPKKLDYKVLFPGPTGTNSVEAALKLARKAKKRNTVWAFTGAFHGMTLGALALTTEAHARGGAGVALNDVVHIPTPNYVDGFDSIKYMETILNDDHSGFERPAALIMETVQCEGGIVVFDADFLKRVREFCTKEDIVLIIDDIQAGCSRTGTFFSFERAGIIPDMVCMSKSIGGYGLPLAILLLKSDLDVFTPGEHNGTFRGNQLAFVSARLGIEFNINNEVDKQVKEKEQIVKNYLENEIKPLLKDNEEFHGIGLAWGIQFESGKKARMILDKCYEYGLIIELAGRDDSVLKIFPALVIDENTLLEGLSIIKKAIESLGE
jgi:diaminobutyrate-2-oxoglutarate transaminase